jgi:hypothetical protein
MIAGVVLVALTLAACSGGDDGGGGGGTGGAATGGDTSQNVSAEAYAKSLCTSMQTYITDVTDLSNTFVSNLDPSADLAGQRDAVIGFLDDVLAATDALISDLEGAGVPDVEGGADITSAVKQSFDRARSVIEDAKSQVQGLSLDDPTQFASRLSDIGTTIQTSLGDIGGSLSALNSPQLSEAVAAEPACASVASAAGGGSGATGTT